MKKGMVYLVGAGPGDYELITLRAISCIQKADVIFYDRLANDRYLSLARPDCELVYAGKRAGEHAIPQRDLNQIIADRAKEGKIVVRLKGGDPYVFGRGAEEAQALAKEGVTFEIVPGVTSAIGGLCYAGIPITHREFASSFHVITGHTKDEGCEAIDWEVVSKLEGTLVFLMGLSSLSQITCGLLSHGKGGETPAAVVGSATTSGQKVVAATLSTLADAVSADPVDSPAMIVVGRVVSLRDELCFFEKRPLFGKTVVVTRARAQSGRLLSQLADAGARAVSFPTIRVGKLESAALAKAAAGLGNYTYAVFTSQNAAEVFFEELVSQGRDSRAFAGVKICAIGTSTARFFEERGLKPDLVPSAFSSDGMWEALKGLLTPEDRVLMPRAKSLESGLAARVREICPVEEVAVYETLPDPGAGREAAELLLAGKAHYITFSSPSTVRYAMALLGARAREVLSGAKLVSIGPVTSGFLREQGFTNLLEASPSTAEGIFKAVIEDASRSGGQTEIGGN